MKGNGKGQLRSHRIREIGYQGIKGEIRDNKIYNRERIAR